MSTLYGLGLGPGDPELITLKAWRIIGQAPVIAYLAANGGESTAREIAKPFIPDDVVELAIDMPMRTERAPGEAAYDKGAAAIAAHLEAGRDVAFLCEGDPFFYGSFMYLFGRLSERFDTIVVPGVTSITAAAAQMRRPLAARNEVVKVLPATLDADRLREELAAAESAAIIKVGRHLSKVRGVLGLLDLTTHAVIIEKATRPEEAITPLSEFTGDTLPYFSTILVYTGREAW